MKKCSACDGTASAAASSSVDFHISAIVLPREGLVVARSRVLGELITWES
jgi:hypothetical protein